MKAENADKMEEMSRTACEKLTSNPIYDSASVVMLYSPLKDEVDTRYLINDASASGKTVLLPVVVGEELEIRVYTGEESMESGAYDIMEPTGEVWTGDVDLIVTPGIAFSKSGQRVGRGKGYYDRLLKTIDCYKIGICFSFQLMDLSDVIETHDVKMNEVIWG